MMGVGIRGVGVARARGFNPATLFQGGTVPGAWYDPSDLSTMFTTSAGTTPVAMPGQGAAVSVGLMLDKSQGLVGLGAQLVVNGDFSTGDLTNWQSSNGGSFALSSNRLQVTGAGANTTGAAYTLNTTVGAAYAVSFVVTLGTATVVDSQMSLSAVGGAGIANSYQYIASNQTITYYFVATAATTYFQFLPRGTGLTAFIDDFSVKTLGPGNHAISFNNTTARPELRARVNLLTYSEEFDNAAWVKTNATAANTSATTDPLGGTTAEIITALAGTAGKFVRQNLIVPSNVTFSVYAKADTQRYIQLMSDGDTEAYANFDLQAGAGQTGTKGTKTTSSITDVGNGWYRCVATFTGATAGVSARVFFVDNASALWFANSTTTGAYYLWGADLRPANIGANVPAYQRIADANTYDTSGFPLYLFFDGIDDSMYTPANLNLSGTDKVTVFAGVRKLSDAAVGVISELSSSAGSGSNPGTFILHTQTSPVGYRYAAGSGASGAAFATDDVSTFTSPISNVITGTSDFAGATIANEIGVRVNGVVPTQSIAGTVSTGNFGTYPLFIGARNNANLWFNGHLHSLIIAGSAVSAGNISATEQWVAGKTGIQI